MLSKEDIEVLEDSFIQVVVGVMTGITAGIIILAFTWLELNFVLGAVFVIFAVLTAFFGIVGCKYIIRRQR